MTRSFLGEELVSLIRRALQRLYDPVELRRSLLGDLFGLSASSNRVSDLRGLLTAAIRDLKPDDSTTPGAVSQRNYNILIYRFVEQLSQKEVAGDMAISLRQLQRLESQALRELAEVLAARADLALVWQDQDVTGPDSEAEGEPPGEPILQGVQNFAAEVDDIGTEANQVAREIEWLRQNFIPERIDLKLLVISVLEILRPLLISTGVKVEILLPPSLADIRGQETSIRQAFLSLIEIVVQHRPRTRMVFSAKAGLNSVQLCIQILAEEEVLSFDDLDETVWNLPAKLFAISSAQLRRDSNGWFELSFKPHDLPLVLVVDDNQDTLTLLERYLAGSDYRFMAASSPQDALDQAVAQMPAAVILDVMLPGMDGWSLLEKMRAAPATANSVLILSSILPSERMAAMLGADGFLRKPFTRQELLAMLENLMAGKGPEPG